MAIIFPGAGTFNTAKDAAQYGIFEYSIDTFKPSNGGCYPGGT